MLDTRLMEQIAPYQPWLTIAGVFLLFLLLRITRAGLRQRVDEIGYWSLGERGRLIWFWLNAPGVILHELSHAFVVLLFYPFGFHITSITLFRVKPTPVVGPNGRTVRSGGRQSLQLGEVQYVRPQGRLMSYIGDGLSGIAPLIGGTIMFTFLYWVATGFNLWDFPLDAHQRLQLLRPGWPWWTLIFAPYLILTVGNCSPYSPALVYQSSHRNAHSQRFRRRSHRFCLADPAWPRSPFPDRRRSARSRSAALIIPHQSNLSIKKLRL